MENEQKPEQQPSPQTQAVGKLSAAVSDNLDRKEGTTVKPLEGGGSLRELSTGVFGTQFRQIEGSDGTVTFEQETFNNPNSNQRGKYKYTWVRGGDSILHTTNFEENNKPPETIDDPVRIAQISSDAETKMSRMPDKRTPRGIRKILGRLTTS